MSSCNRSCGMQSSSCHDKYGSATSRNGLLHIKAASRLPHTWSCGTFAFRGARANAVARHMSAVRLISVTVCIVIHHFTTVTSCQRLFVCTHRMYIHPYAVCQQSIQTVQTSALATTNTIESLHSHFRTVTINAHSPPLLSLSCQHTDVLLTAPPLLPSTATCTRHC